MCNGNAASEVHLGLTIRIVRPLHTCVRPLHNRVFFPASNTWHLVINIYSIKDIQDAK